MALCYAWPADIALSRRTCGHAARAVLCSREAGAACMSAVQRVRSEASPMMSLEAAARRRSMSSARACQPRA